jgi:hypothetical protein
VEPALNHLAFVAEQGARLRSAGVAALRTPRERVHVPQGAAVAARVGLSLVAGTPPRLDGVTT